MQGLVEEEPDRGVRSVRPPHVDPAGQPLGTVREHIDRNVHAVLASVRVVGEFRVDADLRDDPVRIRREDPFRLDGDQALDLQRRAPKDPVWQVTGLLPRLSGHIVFDV